MEEKNFEIEIAKAALLGHNCSNCIFHLSCSKPEKDKYEVCLGWEKYPDDVNGIMKVVRLTYPKTIANEILSVQPMKLPEEKIQYIKYSYNKDKNCSE